MLIIHKQEHDQGDLDILKNDNFLPRIYIIVYSKVAQIWPFP